MRPRSLRCIVTMRRRLARTRSIGPSHGHPGSRIGRSPSSPASRCAARRCASCSTARLTPGGCGPGSGRAAGAASELGRPARHPGALQRPHWGSALTGQPRRFSMLPAVLRQRLQPIHPPFHVKERVVFGRHRGLPLRLHAPPNGERRVLRHGVKAWPFGWPGLGALHGSQVSGQLATQLERRCRVHASSLFEVAHAALVLDGEEEAFHAPYFGG